MNHHEQRMIEVFILKNKRKRYMQFLSNPKSRKKFLKQLAHFKDFDLRNVINIPENQQTEDKIIALLLGFGADKECYVISEDNKIDNSQMLLKSAIQNILGRGMGTIISCIPGILLYYEGEDERLFLRSF